MNRSDEYLRLLCCPNCHGGFQQLQGGLQCMKCGASYGVSNGIACLLPETVRDDYSLISRHSQLNQRAAEIGWQSAILEHTDLHFGPEGIEYTREYICSEARADFRFLMPITKDSIVLDLGSGWGNVTTSFARVTRHVVAMDTNLDNLGFVQLRAQQEGLLNVTAVQGDACNLPATPATYDAVTMVGVLEWVAWGRQDGAPAQLQKQALEKVYNALKPRGVLYLAIENRFSFKYFLGIREPHTRLPFISLLPMKLAQTYSDLARKQDYREVTYSLQGLTGLLQSVGFDQVDVWFPVPGYQNFHYMVDLEDKDVARFVLNQLRAYPRFTRSLQIGASAMLTLPLGLARFFWPSFSVLAVRS